MVAVNDDVKKQSLIHRKTTIASFKFARRVEVADDFDK